VDNLVLAELSYLDLTGIVPECGTNESISVADAATIYEKKIETELETEFPLCQLLQRMSGTKRFRDARLSNYTDVLDEESNTQFAALHIELDDGSIYVAFRGTDDTIVGWREDFSISFQIVSAQKLAVHYLEATMKDLKKCYRVGGHSKGGNLAVYATMMCPAEKQEHILEIYCNDGPGICDEIVDMTKYEWVRPKLIRIVPEFSIIGALFEQEEPTVIVASSVDGILQHDAMTWEIEGDHFKRKKERTGKSKFLNNIFDTWIGSADMEHKKTFVKDFFNALEAGGAKRIVDISQGGVNGFEVVLLSLIESEKRTKIVIGKLIESFSGELKNIDILEVIKSRQAVRGFLLFGIGLLFMMIPKFVMECIGIGLGFTALLWLGKKLMEYAIQENLSVKIRRQRLLLYLILTSICSFLIGNRAFLSLSADFILGIVLIIIAFGKFREVFQKDKSKGIRLCMVLFGILALMLGLVAVATPGRIMTEHIFTVGTFMILYGIGKVLFAMYESSK